MGLDTLVAVGRRGLVQEREAEAEAKEREELRKDRRDDRRRERNIARAAPDKQVPTSFSHPILAGLWSLGVCRHTNIVVFVG